MATVDVKYLTVPHDGTPGTPWDDFEERILGVAAGKTDDRGWSLAEFRDVMMNNNAPLRDTLAAAACQLHGDASRMAKRLAAYL